MLKNLLLFIILVLSIGMILTVLFGQRDPTDLGVKDGMLKPCPDTPNCVSSQSGEASQKVKPLAVPKEIHDPIGRLKRIIESQGRTEVLDEEADYLWVRFTSRTFRFKDDLECYYDPDAGVIHLRSASRLGRYDFGVNRKRVEMIRELFANTEP